LTIRQKDFFFNLGAPAGCFAAIFSPGCFDKLSQRRQAQPPGKRISATPPGADRKQKKESVDLIPSLSAFTC
jgi:hypothetical protein